MAERLLLLAVATLTAVAYWTPGRRITERYQRIVDRNTESIVRIETVKGFGGGFIISEDGFILTCEHLIGESKASYVMLYADPEPRLAQTIVTFSDMDVALIQLVRPPEGLRPVTFGVSGEVRKMDPVVFIGHPAGLNWMTSLGRVNRREYYGLKEMLQIDAVTAPGGSGGGVFNTDGELIGMFQSIRLLKPDALPMTDFVLVLGVDTFTQTMDIMKIMEVARAEIPESMY